MPSSAPQPDSINQPKLFQLMSARSAAMKKTELTQLKKDLDTGVDLMSIAVAQKIIPTGAKAHVQLDLVDGGWWADLPDIVRKAASEAIGLMTKGSKPIPAEVYWEPGSCTSVEAVVLQGSKQVTIIFRTPPPPASSINNALAPGSNPAILFVAKEKGVVSVKKGKKAA